MAYHLTNLKLGAADDGHGLEMPFPRVFAFDKTVGAGGCQRQMRLMHELKTSGGSTT